MHGQFLNVRSPLKMGDSILLQEKESPITQHLIETYQTEKEIQIQYQSNLQSWSGCKKTNASVLELFGLTTATKSCHSSGFWLRLNLQDWTCLNQSCSEQHIELNKTHHVTVSRCCTNMSKPKSFGELSKS